MRPELNIDSILGLLLLTAAIAFVLIRFWRTVSHLARDTEVQGLFGMTAITLLSGTLIYRAFEGWSYVDSLYFTVITLTTVGYGDFAPQTTAGKLFTIVYILLGLGIISSFIVLVAERNKQWLDERRKK